MIRSVFRNHSLRAAMVADWPGRSVGAGRLAAIGALVLSLAAPALAGGFATQRVEEPAVIELTLETDLLAYDLCWAEDVSGPRSELVAQAASAMDDPLRMYVLDLPQLPAGWEPAARGVMRDSSGGVIPRSHIAIRKGAYEEDVEEALVAIIGMIREERPGALVSINGFRPEESRLETHYEALYQNIDFAFADVDMNSLLTRSQRVRSINYQLNRSEDWMNRYGLAEGRPLMMRRGGEEWWMIGYDSLEGFVDRSEEDFEEWEHSDQLAQNDAPIEGESVSTYDTTATQANAPTDAPGDENGSSESDGPAFAAATARSADINGDGVVNSQDRAELLGHWGTDEAVADLNGDGVVNAADLAVLLGQYSDDAEDTPVPPEGLIVPALEEYDLAGDQDMGFMVTEGDSSRFNVVFQVWSTESQSVEAAYTDSEPPFIYPSAMLAEVTPGMGQVQAIVRDGSYRQVGTFARNVEFVSSNDQPSGGGGTDLPDGNDGPFVYGMNLSGVGYYTREWTFSDIFKSSKPWSSNSAIEYADDGWPLLQPGQQVNTLMFRGMDGLYPAGEYTVTWEGEGRVSIPGFDVDGASWSNPISDTTGRFTFTISNPRNNGIALKIDESNRDNHVRNISVYPPGISPDSAPVFHPLFVERLSPFKVLRFMPWCGVGQQQTVRWADRRTPDSPRQAGLEGVAVEYMCQLANEIDADPWFCMPHLATDNFMRQFAITVKQHLDPDRKVYIEFSNEMWNGIFPQAQWGFQEANRLNISFQEHYAMQCLRMFEIWEDVFSDEPERLKRVIGTQLVNHGVTNGILNHIPEGAADILSPAAYFQVNEVMNPDDITENTPLEVIFDAARQGITLAEEDMAWCVQRAEDKGMEVVAYEGGQHLADVFGGDHPAIAKFAEANQDPRMYDLYIDHFTRQQAAGAKGICHLTYISDQDSQYGAWGSLDHQTQPISEAPKYRALIDLIAQQQAPVP